MMRFWLLVGWVACLTGCCATVPAPEKYFHRMTPHDALRMFQYALETEQYDAAYTYLSSGTREAVSRTKFKLGIRFAEIEQWDGLSAFDFVVDGYQIPTVNYPNIIGPNSFGVTVAYGDDDYEQAITMLKEDALWCVDLLNIKGFTF